MGVAILASVSTQSRVHSEVSQAMTAALFRQAGRESSGHRIGIEIERIGLWPSGHALCYEAVDSRVGAAELLNVLSVRYGWPRIDNGSGRPGGVARICGEVSLEPGSQLEFSTETNTNLLLLRETVRCIEKDIDEVTLAYGLRWVGIGLNPISAVNAIDLIQLARYHIMDRYLPTRGTLGTSMMRLTGSVQVNVDYSNEAEAIDMLRVALCLTPLSYAMFANSPWYLSKRSEYLSYRGHVWRHTDAVRAGILKEAFVPDFSFDDYTRHVWSTPLMFAETDRNVFVDAGGASLNDIKANKLEGATATGKNEMHAIRQIFTEARLKPGYIEIRSIDGQTTPMRYAAAAFWLGVLYSRSARALCLSWFGGLTAQARDLLWESCLREGLSAKLGVKTMREAAGEIMSAAKASLLERGFGEEELLGPLEETVCEGVNPAQVLIERFGDDCRRDFPAILNYLSG